jgi:hypothetical protein
MASPTSPTLVSANQESKRSTLDQANLTTLRSHQKAHYHNANEKRAHQVQNKRERSHAVVEGVVDGSVEVLVSVKLVPDDALRFEGSDRGETLQTGV